MALRRHNRIRKIDPNKFLDINSGRIISKMELEVLNKEENKEENKQKSYLDYNTNRKISIVIPVYKSDKYDFFLTRLINSIYKQKYNNYEIIISDHSSDDDIFNLIKNYNNINYYKCNYGQGNISINTNNGIKKCSGEIIKIMHMDDFFYNDDTLDKIQKIPLNYSWGACSYNHFYESQNKFDRVITPDVKKFIGNPSTSFFLNDNNFYDENLLFLLDDNFHKFLLKKYGNPFIIHDICISIGVHENQSSNIYKKYNKEEEDYNKLKISVIMASFLGDYPNRAKNPEEKFKRAVNSFINQTFKNKELIIVSDGCDKTKELYDNYYKKYQNIFLYNLDKQPLFSGKIRNKGIEKSGGDIICYLDSDDFFGENHLTNISNQFNLNEYDWVYYDDFLINNYIDGNYERTKRNVDIVEGSIGTSAICHKKDNIYWGDGYGHDWFFVKKLLHKTHKKIHDTSYNVCHIPKLFDF